MTEELARAVALRNQPRPVERWELPAPKDDGDSMFGPERVPIFTAQHRKFEDDIEGDPNYDDDTDDDDPDDGDISPPF